MTEVLLEQALLLSLAIVLLWAVRRPLRRLGAGAVYAAWLLVPALLLTPALPRPAQEPLRLVLQATGGPAAPALPKLPAPADHRATALLALWLAGAALIAAVQARRQWRLARLGPRLPAGSSPALVGLLRPRIALPTDFEQRFSPAERELILAHEQVHRERLDNLWNLLACALTALHWWNPLAWWAARRMQADQELACDAVVLAARLEARATYARALLAAHGLTPPRAPLASRWGSTHPLVERIAMLNRPTPLTRRHTLLLGLCLASTVGMAYAMQATPPAATPGGASIRLALSLVFQEGDVVRRSTVSLVGRDGETMKVVVGAQPANAEPGFSVELTPAMLDDEKFQLDVAFSGLPPALQNGPQRVIARYGDAATLESVDAKTSTRTSVFLVGTRVAAPAGATTPAR